MISRLVLLSGLLVVASGCADSLVLPSNHDVISPGDLQRRVIEVNGKAVEVWTTRSPGAAARDPAAFVLYFGGNGDRADRWLQVLPTAGARARSNFGE